MRRRSVLVVDDAGAGGTQRLVDLPVIIVAATIASPVAWNHHYGVLFPVFATILPVALQAPRRSAVLACILAVAYLAISLEFVAPDFMFESRWRGILSSHIFFGGLLLFWVLVVMRRQGATPDRPPPVVHELDGEFRAV